MDNYYASRYVSDDFCVIMPNVNELQANEFGGRIKYSLSCQNVDDVGPIKVSIGVTTINQNDESFDVEKFFRLQNKQCIYQKASLMKQVNPPLSLHHSLSFGMKMH
ncbi:MAG: hypothetical protein L6V95_13365 [Candidatus Melainabacteria bacterium]|nr:MAG: hypothetical protein L6V95_13365 [Candidatus Melainabacteria bacterium]